MARSQRAGNRPTIRRMLETAPARVAAPMGRPVVDEPIPDESVGWKPLDLPRAVRSRRTYRIPVIVLALLAAAALYYAGQYALRLPVAHAEEQRDTYASILQTAADAIPGLQSAAAAITDPTLEDYGSHLALLVRVEGISAELAAAADRRLPLTLPGLPSQDLEMLEPIRDRMDSVAEGIALIGGVLNDVATYRRSLDGMFLLPELPGPAEGPSVDEFSDRLAHMTAATVGAASLLPDGELFGDHRSQVEALLMWLPEWQADYLETLREGNLGQADRLRDEAVERVERLRTELTGPLHTAADWTAAAIDQLAADIQSALILTG